MLQIQSPYAQFFDADGEPLNGGSVYIGQAGLNPETDPIAVYWDAGGTIPAAQPIKTLNGYITRAGTPSRVYINQADYSITVKDVKGRIVFTTLNATSLANLQQQLASTTDPSQGDAMIGFKQAGLSGVLIGAVGSTVHDKLIEFLSVRDFGAHPSKTAAQNQAAFEAALTAALSEKKGLRIPSGTYLYSGWAGLDQNDITIVGEGSSNTVLKYTGASDALLLGTPAGFRQGVNIAGFTVEGNANATSLVKARAIARSKWSDINVREANHATGIGFVLQGCMLNNFDFLVCSTDRNAMTNIPAEGFNIEALAPYGNSSNNVFTNLYAEGPGRVANTLEYGVRMNGGDQNVFIGGSPESCGTYGLLIGSGCRYNTLIGTGFENLNATGGDVGDGGISTRYINCYSSQKFIIQGRSIVVEGGYFERLQVDAGAARTRIRDVLVNGWATGAGGFYDSGTGTETQNVYDADLAAFINDRYPRFLMATLASQNNTTGAGSEYTMTWNTIFDDNNNCDGTYFAAPVKGRYQLNAYVSLSGLSTAATLVTLKIQTTQRTYVVQKGLNPKTGALQDAISLSAVADMNAGDGALVKITVEGMAGNTVTVIGNATNMWSTFSGHKIN